MAKQRKPKLDEIIGGLQCPVNFRCYKSKYKDLCKAQDIGMESFLVCLDKNPQKCKFSFSFGFKYFCKCPLRVFIAKEFKR
jgi:hypothetical protein